MVMESARLAEWRIKEGDQINKGDIVLVIETEKTTYEVEASASGYVHILVDPDTVAPVSKIVGLIAETKEELEALQKEPKKEMFTTDVKK